jgi:tRNA-splicing ligase RtcB
MYSRIAREIHPELDKATAYLGWLAMNSEAGQEYWLSMELAGRFKPHIVMMSEDPRDI